MSTTVYVLLLADCKYYVGKTEKDVGIRYREHVSGRGSAWTRMYKPLMLIKTFPNADPYDEDKRTKEYMALYGIDNVRGGSYVQMDLNEDHRAAIQREIWMAENRCTKCGIKGHYAKDCNAQAVVTASKRGRDDDSEDKEEKGGIRCHHCGQSSLMRPKYRATWHINDTARDGSDPAGHVTASCHALSDVKGYVQVTPSKAVEVKGQVASATDEVSANEEEIAFSPINLAEEYHLESLSMLLDMYINPHLSPKIDSFEENHEGSILLLMDMSINSLSP